MLFTRRLPSWQTEAVAVVARRSERFLRLDLLCQIVPSDLWLRNCCILRFDRLSQGFPKSKASRRTLATPLLPRRFFPSVEFLPVSTLLNPPAPPVAFGVGFDTSRYGHHVT